MTWVFWVHASNAARFEQSYRDIAGCVKIAGRQDPQANIFELVHDWLRDCKHRWLVVLDNVDDARFLLDRPATNSAAGRKPLREYLPHCERGSILVTTRNAEAAIELVERRDMVTVEPMDEPSAVALLKKKLGILDDSSEVTELAVVLEYMPLAIVQAAAYISQNAPRCSVAKYLDDYRKSERKRTNLLNYDKGHLRRDGQANNSIVVTWQVSFEYIQQTRSSAADLLSLMSFFDRQGISETLIRSQIEHRETRTSQREYDDIDSDSVEEDDTSPSSGSDDDAFEDDVRTLRNFCFVTVDNEGTNFQMHALVQLATRMWLAANGRLEQHRQQFIRILCASFPTGEYENWAICQTLFAHAKTSVEQQPEGQSSLIEWATLLFNAAWYAWRKGSASDAKKLAEKSVAARREALGKDHIDTLKSMTILAYSLTLNGQPELAERLHTEVMGRSKMKLGADHPVTLTSMGSLASTYRDQGRQKAAEEMLVEVIRIRKTKQGKAHPDTLSSMHNLALTYSNQRRLDEAGKLLVQVIGMSKTGLGVDHPDTLISMHNLASTYTEQRRWNEAERLQVQVMKASKTKLGADHPDTLSSVENLAWTYCNQGRWDDAAKLFVQVIETRKSGPS
jgi:tetratricopeptide (TPR) repeat protein